MTGWIIAAGLLVLAAAAALARSFYEQGHVTVKEYAVESERLGKAFDGYTMAVLADLHDKGAGRRNNRMMAAIRRLHPDAVMAAGDLVFAKGGKCRFEESLRILKRLAYRYPVYYSLGNHEERMRRENPEAWSRWYREVSRTGTVLLDNVSVTLRDGGDALTITGLSMGKAYYKKKGKRVMEPEFLKDTLGVASASEYHILLAHSPAYFPDYAAWGADLALSGHYHGGTVRLPGLRGVFSPDFRLFPRYSYGLYRRGKSVMAVSGGLGTHTINFRLGNPSELVVIRLKSLEK